ncbi:MAG: hypothetical protein MJB12_05100 [Firmicutes bacterium]|nr:hypothetical protein [Bacillota bacterium]
MRVENEPSTVFDTLSLILLCSCSGYIPTSALRSPVHKAASTIIFLMLVYVVYKATELPIFKLKFGIHKEK